MMSDYFEVGGENEILTTTGVTVMMNMSIENHLVKEKMASKAVDLMMYGFVSYLPLRQELRFADVSEGTRPLSVASFSYRSPRACAAQFGSGFPDFPTRTVTRAGDLPALLPRPQPSPNLPWGLGAPRPGLITGNWDS
ncbi:hypothetical protein DPX16_12928 [Anabarilius grahami]|uniref:Uncharacterized protein n=1 Tax=Anabarilius grahami TaxID=495550 RepID=A0A3N0XDC4_ANAGA|nr:hypothetical protein DPX16_12928 [Anabarilius grahami]